MLEMVLPEYWLNKYSRAKVIAAHREGEPGEPSSEEVSTPGCLAARRRITTVSKDDNGQPLATTAATATPVARASHARQGFGAKAAAKQGGGSAELQTVSHGEVQLEVAEAGRVEMMAAASATKMSCEQI